TCALPIYEEFDVDDAGRAVLPACKQPGVAYGRKSFVVLPSAVRAWLGEREREIPDAPVFAPGCEGDTGAGPPTIVTPGEGQIITLIPGVPAERQAVALAGNQRDDLPLR